MMRSGPIQFIDQLSYTAFQPLMAITIIPSPVIVPFQSLPQMLGEDGVGGAASASLRNFAVLGFLLILWRKNKKCLLINGTEESNGPLNNLLEKKRNQSIN